MAAITVTASAVVYVSGPKDDGQVAGEAFAAGAALYLSSTDGKWYKAQADGTAAQAGADGYGMALFTADAAGARGSVARPGAKVTMNAALTAGVAYFIHGTAGSFGVYSELASTNKSTIFCVAVSTSQLLLVQAYDAGAVLA